MNTREGAVEAVPQPHAIHLAAIRLAVRFSFPVRIVRDGRTINPPLPNKRELNVVRARLWRAQNPGRVLAYRRRWYAEHREEHLARAVAYAKQNREHVSAMERERRRKRRLENNAAELRARPLTSTLTPRNHP